MKLTRQSIAMLIVAAVLAVLVAVDLRSVVVPPPALPVLPAITLNDARKITIGDQINVLTIARESESEPWRLLAPLDYPADEDVVREFLKAIGGGISMDALVDSGNLEQYTVDDQHALRVDVWALGDEPAITFFVGKTAGPKSSFVRLPASETVYRADVGPRTRFERPATAWREKGILPVERTDVVELRLQRGTELLIFRRGASPGNEADGKPIPGPFGMDGAPFAIDAESVEMLARTLTRMRAGEIHNANYEAGMQAPAAVATLVMKNGDTHAVRLGSKLDEKASFVQVSDRTEVFRTSAQVGAQLLAPLDQFRDKAIAKLDRQKFDTMTWVEGGLTTTLAWSAEAIKWVVTQPANVDADQRAAATTAANLATFRAMGVATDGAFTPSGVTVKIRLSDGTTWELSFGQAVDGDGGKIRAKVAGRNDVFFLDPRQVAEIRAGFGKG